MVDDEAVRSYQDLSVEFLDATRANAESGRLAPAYHSALHALELAVKAALASRMPRVPRTHNVGGLLGQEFRDVLGSETCSRVNQLLHAYDEPRYPEWDPPQDIAERITFISDFVLGKLPFLLEEPR